MLERKANRSWQTRVWEKDCDKELKKIIVSRSQSRRDVVGFLQESKERRVGSGSLAKAALLIHPAQPLEAPRTGQQLPGSSSFPGRALHCL